jgi:hypothetical protein
MIETPKIHKKVKEIKKSNRIINILNYCNLWGDKNDKGYIHYSI